jgi:hypothetical protein
MVNPPLSEGDWSYAGLTVTGAGSLRIVMAGLDPTIHVFVY